jgi:hypothetical protein
VRHNDCKKIAVATYHDSINNYNPNILNGTDPSGDTFDLGSGLDWCTGVGTDTFNMSGGFLTAPYKNLSGAPAVTTSSISLDLTQICTLVNFRLVMISR